MDHRTVLGNKFGGHLQTTLDRAQIRISGQRTELALRQRQFEGADRSIRDMGKGTGGYPGLTYERIANQVNCYFLIMQYRLQLWTCFVSMTDEARGSFEWDGEDRGD
jgi:hypothetical protein